MIIKSSQRSSPQELANHLTKLSENENIIFSDSRAILAEDVHGALDDMDDIARGSSCNQHLYHVSINPDHEMDAKEWQQTWQLYETEFGLENQPFIEVTHVKEGRLHKHRVYERIQDDGKAIHLAFNRIRNEKISRVLEHEFGHELTLGKHNRAVIKKLRAEGKEEIADWLEQQHAHEQSRPVAEKNHADLQQEKRTKLTVEQVKTDLKSACEATDNGKAFEAAIAEKGYLLAKGDKRDFVIVDPVGGVHSPRRRLGVKAKELRQKWQDLNPAQMPTVEQVKDLLSPERQSKREWQQKDTEQKIEDLTEQWSKVQQEIDELTRNREGKEVEQASTVTAQSHAETQQPARSQTKKQLKQRLIKNHRQNRLAKPVKKRRRASRAATPRTAYRYRKRVWLQRQSQKLEQSQLHESIEQAVTQSQTHIAQQTDKEKLISPKVQQRTVDTLLPSVLPNNGSQDDEPTVTKPQKGQGHKTPTDSAKDKDQRKDIETWTKLRGEGRDSIKPLIGEAQPTVQPTIRDYHRITDETLIPTNKTALTEAGFFESESEPDPPNPKDDFAKIQKNSPSTFSMVWQSVLRKITTSASKAATRYATRQAEKRQQREAVKEKERQLTQRHLENKREHGGDLSKREEKYLAKEHERQTLKSQQQHREKMRDELEQFYKDHPHLRTDQMMVRGIGEYSKQEQQQIQQMLQQKQRAKIQHQSYQELEAQAEVIKPHLNSQPQKDLDGRIESYKFFNDNPDWSAQERIQQAGKTKEWRGAILKSGHSLDNANLHPDRQLSPLEEYRAELARTTLKHDMTNMERHKNPRNAIETDKTIAFKMYGAGYSKEEVSQAVRQGSPNTANLSAKESHMYIHQQIHPVLEDQKSQELRATVNKVREQDGIEPQERRLDQLRLAEDYKSQSQSLEQKTPANTTEAEPESDTGVGY